MLPLTTMDSVFLRLAADAVLILHLGFVLFVACGGLLAWRIPRLAWLHVPAFLWGTAVELGGLGCPLTRLENQFLQASGGRGYEGDFITHYLLPALYPTGLTRDDQIGLGVAVVAINGLLYGIRLYRSQRAPHHGQIGRSTGTGTAQNR